MVYCRREYLPLEGSKNPTPEHPLTRAILYNQPDERFWDFWRNGFLRERERQEMPDYVATGLVGMGYTGLAPNVMGIVEGANQAKRWSLNIRQIVDILAQAFARVWSEFAGDFGVAEDSLRMAQALESGWSEPILVAWLESLSGTLRAQEAGMHAFVQNVVAQVGVGSAVADRSQISEGRERTIEINEFIEKVRRIAARPAYREAKAA
jgi:hypothetical protein